MRRTGNVTDTRDLGPHDHVCWEFSTVRDWRSALASYLDTGADRGDRLVYTSPLSLDELRADLEMLPRGDELQASGQLQVVPHPLPPSDPVQAVALLPEFQGLVHQMTTGGHAVRIASRVRASDLADNQQGFAAFELLVDEVVTTTRTTLLCGLEQRRGEVVDPGVRLVHPSHGPLPVDQDEPVMYADQRGWVLRGSFDLSRTHHLRAALAALLADAFATQRWEQHLDLAGVSYMDVGNARSVVELAASLSVRGHLVVRGAPAWWRELVAVCWPDAIGLQWSASG